ncbi:MAG: hypothetical protein KY396_00920 [Actinobacteria bacterium]|nr:hypothetical protein [Actinomycetota bacterium]
MTSVKKPVPLVYWPLWMTLLGLALVVFYVFLTPIWMGIRVLAWLSERGSTVFESREPGR